MQSSRENQKIHVGKSEELPPRVFHIQPNSGTFGEYYDEVQELLKSMAGMDEFLQGINMDNNS